VRIITLSVKRKILIAIALSASSQANRLISHNSDLRVPHNTWCYLCRFSFPPGAVAIFYFSCGSRRLSKSSFSGWRLEGMISYLHIFDLKSFWESEWQRLLFSEVDCSDFAAKLAKGLTMWLLETSQSINRRLFVI